MPPEPIPPQLTTGEQIAPPDATTSLEKGESDLSTGSAPTYCGPLSGPPTSTEPLAFARPGTAFDDFELIHELGAGAFGKVFLARQLSLDRSVALKITARRGHEARTLANLEHDHIVRVFSETFDRERGLLLLCMQYVPGTTLARVIGGLAVQSPETWSGRAILAAIDAVASGPAVFDPAALRDRELLAACDFPEAVCWIGTCLALALAHAHANGVLHRDVKPANILLNRYGRPMLVDFNIAFDPRAEGWDGHGPAGGTLAYMAPEHIDAFVSAEGMRPGSIDERADVYALGLVLFELVTGRRPFSRIHQPDESAVAALIAMAAERRSGTPVCGGPYGHVLNPVIRRCLEPDPARRYQSAAELATALDGCRELHRAGRRLPAGGRLTRLALVHPFWCMAVLGLLPHVLASIVNISYNGLRIVLSPAQQAAFLRVTFGYNALVYPAACAVLYALFVPLFIASRAQAAGTLDDGQAELRRRQSVRLPLWIALLSAVGWLPGGLLFPWLIGRLSDPLSGDLFGHFFVSFTIAGLIALTYSVLAVQFVSLRVLYPRFGGDGRSFLHGETRAELRPVEKRLVLLSLLAGAIPLAGAVLLMGVGPEQFTSESYRSFRLLVTSLIILGMAGFAVALSTTAYLRKTLAALEGSNRPPSKPVQLAG